MTFYWPNRQYYVSGHDKHSAEPLPPVLPSTENVQVKKYQIRARHANTNFFALMDPLVCPVLNLAVYVKMFGMQGPGQKFFIWKSNCRFAEYLEKLFTSSHFKAARKGKLGTHSLCKGPSTYASRFGLLRDWISFRGCWRASKKQVGVYIVWTCRIPMQKL